MLHYRAKQALVVKLAQAVIDEKCYVENIMKLLKTCLAEKTLTKENVVKVLFFSLILLQNLIQYQFLMFKTNYLKYFVFAYTGC